MSSYLQRRKMHKIEWWKHTAPKWNNLYIFPWNFTEFFDSILQFHEKLSINFFHKFWFLKTISFHKWPKCWLCPYFFTRFKVFNFWKSFGAVWNKNPQHWNSRKCKRGFCHNLSKMRSITFTNVHSAAQHTILIRLKMLDYCARFCPIMLRFFEIWFHEKFKDLLCFVSYIYEMSCSCM